MGRKHPLKALCYNTEILKTGWYPAVFVMKDVFKPLTRTFKDRKVQILLLILAVGAYLRLWHIQHLFKWIYDYDEGAYSVGGRLISQGHLPYQDFPLVHPPLYDLLLAGIYKVFGYNFFYGRYLSVALFLVCVVLAYLIVKRLYNPTAGLVAAALFAFFPGFYLLWYRVVQEPLGILLILLAAFLAIDYIVNRQHKNRLLFSGLCLGLAVTTKFTLIPAVIGFALGVVILAMEGHWRSWRSVPSGLFSRELGLLVAGIVAGFILVTGFFIAVTPYQFFNQTLLSQVGYRVGDTLGGIVGRYQGFVLGAGTSADTVNTLSLSFPAVIFLALLIRRKFTRANIFLLAALLVSILLCATFDPFGEVRYFTAAFIFALFAMAAFVPSLDTKLFAHQMTRQTALKSAGLIVALLVILGSIGGTVVLMRDYNFMGPELVTYEEEAYSEVVSYLEEVGAKKIYSLSPIVPALSPNIATSLRFDTFGLLFVLREPPKTIIAEQVEEGVDYMIVDAFQWLGLRQWEVAELVIEVRQQFTFVKVVIPGELPMLGLEIYAVPRP
jgi:4-amino-4-deoxy-L-arabinose transferase-like glycosyltransferase